MKKLSQAQLNARKAKGSKVTRKPETETKSVEEVVTPEPVDNSTVDLANKAIESATRVEEAVSKSIAVSDENLKQIKDAIQEAMAIATSSDPRPVDLVVKRRKDGLIDRIRVEPVTDRNLH